MAAEKQRSSNSIPIRFADDEEYDIADDRSAEDGRETAEAAGAADPAAGEGADNRADPGTGGPEIAELVASRAELKRLQTALAEAQDAAARRQADFENYRKRIERERSETHSRAAAEVARKLLPVVDNLARALDAERTVATQESNEFRHFVHGVELISKQLDAVLESLGVQPIVAVGEPFDPHIHEAVATEASDEYEPDTVTEEITRGYRIGDRLLRPSMVKVAARKNEAA